MYQPDKGVTRYDDISFDCFKLFIREENSTRVKVDSFSFGII